MSETLPPEIQLVTLEPPCGYCRSLQGYFDTRTQKYFCARCGKSLRGARTP